MQPGGAAAWSSRWSCIGTTQSAAPMWQWSPIRMLLHDGQGPHKLMCKTWMYSGARRCWCSSMHPWALLVRACPHVTRGKAAATIWLRSPARGRFCMTDGALTRGAARTRKFLWRPEMLTWQHAGTGLQVAEAHHQISTGKAAAHIWQPFRKASVPMEGSTFRASCMHHICVSAFHAAGHWD